MPFVMVPVPEEYVTEVMQYVVDKINGGDGSDSESSDREPQAAHDQSSGSDA
jgi:hypothetical protein